MLSNYELTQLAEQQVQAFPKWPYTTMESIRRLACSSMLPFVIHSALQASSSDALAYLLKSPILHDEVVVVHLMPLVCVAFQSRMWDVWLQYMSSPCWLRYYVKALISDTMMLAGSENLQLFVHALSLFPNLVQHATEVLNAYLYLGCICLSKQRDITPLARHLGTIIEYSACDAEPTALVNIVGRMLRKCGDNMHLDIWSCMYTLLHAAGIPIVSHTGKRNGYPSMAPTRSLHIITPDSSKKYTKQNGSKDLLIAALHHLSYNSPHAGGFGLAFARYIVDSYICGAYIVLLLKRILVHVNDPVVLEYLFVHSGINFYIEIEHEGDKRPMIVHLAKRLHRHGFLDVLMHLVGLQKSTMSYALTDDVLPKDVVHMLRVHEKWSHSTRRIWVRLCVM